ncbi:MAG: histidine kinase [Deltaproteobacteria bacterium]|nr:histidine kinase [Deltaproteobacteria bacterium]MBW2051207.1 histidine kinase [Deltaproteobacteria bacterium]MBW2139848.1 histidine kinase [Deltaproteobacteria bacterium]MBW2322013.1 histidine kinase [Deltaproteobacteria bacterium]
MSCQHKNNSWAGFQFFGEMSASISHEIKNALATINETAGLLEDLTLLLEKGKPLEPERFKILAGRIMKQVQRADTIVKNMNRFAHSTDEPVKDVELGETLELMLTLSERFASMRGVKLEPKSPLGPIAITTIPFFLNHLLWLCVDFAMNAAGQGKTVGLLTEETENGPQIRFTRLEGLVGVRTDEFPTQREKTLLDALKAELKVNTEAGELILVLSGNISP